MGELNVRRNGILSIPRFQGVDKTQKQSTAGQTRKTGQTGQIGRPSSQAAATISQTLRQLMSQVTQLERHLREGRQTLRQGEASLAEVGDKLGKMESLARQAAGGGSADRAALQSQAQQLRGEIERIAQAGIKAGFFQAGDAGESPDALVNAILESLTTQQKDSQALPSWLQTGLTGEAPDRAAILSALGLDSSATGAEILSALSKLPLEGNSTASYLATLYLGSLITTGTTAGADPALAAEGISRFLDAVAQGLTPDQALELLTGGAFTSMADFQAQFTAGTAPGLDVFLTALLLSGENNAALPSILTLLAGGSAGEMSLLMDLLTALGGGGGTLPEGAGSALSQTALTQAALPMEARTGTLLLTGPSFTGALYDPEGGVLTLNSVQNLILRSLVQGQEGPALRLTGSNSITLQQLTLPLLRSDGGQVQLFTAGGAALGQVQLGQGAVLTLSGSGLLQIGLLQGDGTLRLTGGAVTLSAAEAQSLAVILDGPAILQAARGLPVFNAQGQPLEPFDLLWKAILPQWSALTSMAIDGRQAQLSLRDDQLALARLWLLKENSAQGFPAHSILLRGRDHSGQAQVWGSFVRWNPEAGEFQEIIMYPNPFTVTGGEEGIDWSYQEDSQTLTILTAKVEALSGGSGVDANRQPFSGRLVLADGVGAAELTLDGVTCKVTAGRAFDLGRENQVTLLLRRGSENVFESGEGFAGISLGENTSLRIDQTKGSEPDGILIAAAGNGGAGIGRDSGAGQDASGSIHIHGGSVTATGAGGGAGIGGALGGKVGDIRIQGGTVTAQAACCAAAIGAGIQGGCGDIVITGAARVVKAQGGGPDGDIGGCLFGNCGQVRVSADIGGAKLWTQRGLSIQMGEASVTLPRFRLSAQALHLDGLDLSTREAAKAAVAGLNASRRWVAKLQSTYGAMYGQLEQSAGGGLPGPSHFGGVLRDAREADSLLDDMQDFLRQSSFFSLLTPRGAEDVGHLLR